MNERERERETHYHPYHILAIVYAQPEMRKTFTEIFATKTRDQWTEIFSSTK